MASELRCYWEGKPFPYVWFVYNGEWRMAIRDRRYNHFMGFDNNWLGGFTQIDVGF
jgi:hypothetical protein